MTLELLLGSAEQIITDHTDDDYELDWRDDIIEALIHALTCLQMEVRTPFDS